MSLAACSDSFGRPPAFFTNVVDTVTLYALQGTPLQTPSAYDVVNARAARTELGEEFDFAIDLDAQNRLQILPARALLLPVDAALRITDEPFDAIREAPLEEYSTDSVVVGVGSVFVVRSRLSSNSCGFLGALPRYGKFHVLAVNTTERTATFELLVNRNCGYRSLEPGTPDS